MPKSVVNNLIAAVGGAAIGVGSTLLTQKLRKDAVEENKNEILTGLADKIDEAADRVMAKAAETEPAENIAYREAASKVVNESAQKPAVGVKSQKLSAVKTTAPEATDK